MVFGQVQDSEALQRVRTDQSWKLIEQLVQLHQRRYANTRINLLEVDDLFYLAERFLECQQQFLQAGKPVHVQVAFHYTQPENLASIRQDGLVSNNVTQRHGAKFGRGIYVGTNPHAFSVYGKVGIALLFLEGVVKQVDGYRSDDTLVDPSVDCFLGNKLMRKNSHETSFPKTRYFDEIILRQSKQALPIYTYPQSAINSAELMHDLHQHLQYVFDHLFNEGRMTVVQRIYPSLADIRYQHILRTKMNKQSASNPAVASKQLQVESEERVVCPSPTKQFWANKKPYSAVLSPSTSECPICMDPLNQHGPTVCLLKCHHSYHQACLDKALEISNKCPVCRAMTGEPYGTCPAGTMTVQLNANLHCSGYEQFGTRVLTYNIPSGIQAACHDHPGQKFSGTRRVAYIPDTDKGRDLCKRLKYAFAHGLLFQIGTSLSTGARNVVVWASIHHKTRVKGGPHGFPDAGYFVNCNEELDAVGVPNAKDL